MPPVPLYKLLHFARKFVLCSCCALIVTAKSWLRHCIRAACCSKLIMGNCCAPASYTPDDPSVKIYAVVRGVVLKRAGKLVTYEYGQGVAHVKDGVFIYRSNFRNQRLSLYMKDIQKISLERVFRDRGVYTQPCYCCTCTGCPDGIVDIGGTVNGEEVHIGLIMANAEEFAEQLQVSQAQSRENATEY